MLKTYVYKTHGVCSREIVISYEGDVISSVSFKGGCRGNTQGVSKLSVGRKIDDLIVLLEGIECRHGTSCPDQLSKALREIKTKESLGL